MKKTSNKILAALIIVSVLIGMALIIFVKIKGKEGIQLKTELIINDEKVKVCLSSASSEEEIERIALQLMDEKNISIDFSACTFDRDGELKKLEIAIDCNDGHKDTLCVGEFELKMRCWGFERDYSENAKEPFKIGKMEESID
ncbi:MAG: hypothetical protein H8E61_10365 [Bacteroidetes bacterium]|nr:hypothetical protein [Bacteroidota bacterium]